VKTATLSVDALVDRVDRNEIRLPEIQRAYVWKPSQVAGLIDSMYRGYPSGSILLWETLAPVDERAAAIHGPNADPMTKPQYLLDGQQRLSSLHRVFSNHESARVVFNVETERFQIESAATKKDPRWVSVHDVLRGVEGVYALVAQLHERLPDLSPDLLSKRIERVRKINDYPYHVEIVENLEYEQVTDIFVRVNSKGTSLKAVDLALATLSARWPGVIMLLEDEMARWKAEKYRHVDFPFLTRSLAAIANDPPTLRGFVGTPVGSLKEGWDRTKRGLQHAITLLKQNADIPTSDLLPSMNALVPLVTYLGYRGDDPMGADETNSLLYWLMGAFLLQRFSGSVETVIAQDASVIRSGGGIEGLQKNLGIFGVRLAVAEEQLVGRGATSPYFLLSYLAARHAKAKDWWYGTEITLGGKGGFSIEYHHIHPRATLTKSYAKAEINDLSNLAFISAKANKKIRDRSPSKYFPELLDADPDALSSHLVPEDDHLRTADRFRDFVAARRARLAQAMTNVLDRWRPASTSEAAQAATDPTSGDTLSLSILTETYDPLDGVLIFEATRNGDRWTATIPASDFDRLLEDLASGLASDIVMAGERISVDADAQAVEVPIGPFLVQGPLEDWQVVWDREYEDVSIVEKIPVTTDSPPWTGDRVPFSVLVSE
jgi:hypothetical protein